VANLFALNQENLRLIFEHFSRDPKKQKLTLPALTEWMCTERVPEACMISERECQFLFGMSQMPVKEEELKLDHYGQMSLVEFYEFVGRVADMKYSEQPEMDDEPFAEKCGYFMDSFFEVLGLERYKAEDVFSDRTITDDEY
jgi:hypothetical protein